MNSYVDSVLAGIGNLRRNSGLLLGLGIAVMVLGALAIIASRIATLTAVFTFGIILLVTGVLHIVHSISTRKWGGLFLSLAVGVIYLVTGLLLTTHPRLGALALTLVMASFFIATGVFRLVAALVADFPARGWTLANGIISVELGGIIWAQLPFAALWIVGLFVGIEMLFAGWSLVSLAMYIRNLPLSGGQDIRLAA